MRTIRQVAEMTGITVRTLQYYDEIGLLKPSALSQTGYRLYGDEALGRLQQILFFKELGFKLTEINELLQKPDFDRMEAYKRQKELLLLKRNRTDRLIRLLSRLEKGEQCMSFQEFDLTDYINALERFKTGSAEDVIRHWGSVENFDLFIQKIKDNESEAAKLAVKQFGSIEKYTEAMKYNLEHFSELVEKQTSQIPEELKQGDLFVKLASKKGNDPASGEVRQLVEEIIATAYGNAPNELLGDQVQYCNTIISAYSNDYLKTIFDTKHGAGSGDFVVSAFRCYSGNAPAEELP